MARLDRIPEVKEVAQIAACVGREFEHGLLAAITNQPAARLAGALDKLATAELVCHRPGGHTIRAARDDRARPALGRAR